MDSDLNPYEAPGVLPGQLPDAELSPKSHPSRLLIFVVLVAWGGFLGSIWSAVFGYPWQEFDLYNCPEAIGAATGALISCFVFRAKQRREN